MGETILRQIRAVADKKVSRAAFGGSLFMDGDGAPNRATEEVVLTREGLANRTGDLSLLKAK